MLYKKIRNRDLLQDAVCNIKAESENCQNIQVFKKLWTFSLRNMKFN